MVADGQQRITTVNLILSAVMRKAREIGRTEIVSQIEALLFTDVEIYKKWLDHKAFEMTPEGAILDFYRQIPTYIDRKPFYLAMIGVETDSLIWKGHSFFFRMLE